MKNSFVETENLIYKRRNFWTDFFNGAIILFCITIAVFIISFTLMYRNAPVAGKSMQPTLNKLGDTKSDVVYINKFEKYSYGDIIVIKTETATDTNHIIKRVIGMPGDKINIKLDEDGIPYVYLNDEKLIEDYIYDVATSGDPKHVGMQSALYDFNILRSKNLHNENYIVFDKEGNLVLQKNQVFVMGDNRGHSVDSADNGPFSMSEVVGKVDYIIPYGVKPFFYFLYKFTGIKLY